MLDVQKLVLLREVSLHGGVTPAAHALHMSPSNVSQRLQRLEQECGVSLLEPRGRGVRLTRAAERLVAHTERILAISEEAESEIKDASGPLRGSLKLTAFHTFAVGVLSDATRRLAEIAPEIELEFVQLDPEAAIDELLARRADVAVADEYPGHPLPPASGLVQVPIGREPIRAYLPAGIEDAAHAAWALEPKGSDSRRWSTSICRASGFEPRVNFESPDPYVHRRLLEEGLAATFLPASAARDLSTDVKPIPQFPDSMHRRIVMLTRRGTERSRAIIASRQALIEAAAAAGM